jgi:hypothetical protein
MFLSPTAAHEVQTEGHNVRWWESGSVSEQYKEPVDTTGGYYGWLCATER